MIMRPKATATPTAMPPACDVTNTSVDVITSWVVDSVVDVTTAARVDAIESRGCFDDVMAWDSSDVVMSDVIKWDVCDVMTPDDDASINITSK